MDQPTYLSIVTRIELEGGVHRDGALNVAGDSNVCFVSFPYSLSMRRQPTPTHADWRPQVSRAEKFWIA
jgi:hypothetical protein